MLGRGGGWWAWLAGKKELLHIVEIEGVKRWSGKTA